MKRIPRKVLPLLLLTLFAVGLLAAPASADDAAEEVELPPWMEDCIEINDWAAFFESEQAAANEPMCSHSKEVLPPVVTRSAKNANEHYKKETHKVYCRTCDKYWVTRESGITELHVYNPYRRYLGSNHTGPYSSHTYSYGYTCAACGYVKIETVPAGCTAYGCVDPQSLEPPIETCSNDMIFGIYLD